MSNIVNSLAIQFSNNQGRPSADAMAQAYYACSNLNGRWIGLGSNQAALTAILAGPSYRLGANGFADAANRILAAYATAYNTEKVWFGVTGLSALFPNDTSPVFDNGNATGQDTSRPLITGAMVNNVINRCQEFQNWMLSPAGAFNGTNQVETATAVGTITGSGNATVTVTAFGMTNSPKAISVAVTNGDTAATWAGKVRTALAADANVTALYSVSGAGASIVLTSLTPAVYGNDSTLNIALANGTCTGITAAPNSTHTTAGVSARGGTAWLNTVLQVGQYGPAAIALSDAQNFITRCTDLKTNYEASSNTNLNTLLSVSVNPTL